MFLKKTGRRSGNKELDRTQPEKKHFPVYSIFFESEKQLICMDLKCQQKKSSQITPNPLMQHSWPGVKPN
jgi:hypothetical protein